jgi:hypothetical protein
VVKQWKAGRLCPRLARTCIVMSVLLAAPAAPAKQPVPVFRLDVSLEVGKLREDTSLAFISSDRLLVRHHEKLLVFDLIKRKILAAVALDNDVREGIWATHDGNFLARSGPRLVLYDSGLRVVASTEIPYMAEVQVSPSGKLASAAWNSQVILLNTDTLAPISSKTILAFKLANTGFVEPNWLTNGDVYFKPFGGGEKLLLKGNRRCVGDVYVLDLDNILIDTCPFKAGQVVNLEGQKVYLIPDIDGLAFARANADGTRFVLGFQRYSKSHVWRDLNIIADIAGVDDPSDLIVLRAYEKGSGKPTFELSWKLVKDEAMYGRYDNSAVALSPDGGVLATARGGAVEIYQLPGK